MSAEENAGWRDIATAPRDGTVFLARCGDWAPFECQWHGEQFVHMDPEEGPIGYKPDQWQPLNVCWNCNGFGFLDTVPPPPSADAKQADALPGDLREKIAAIIVRKVLQEDYDDLVEGYLDEILMAADEIILLPAYRAVAEAYYSRLSLIQSERGGA